jgi:hypothetical protein
VKGGGREGIEGVIEASGVNCLDQDNEISVLSKRYGERLAGVGRRGERVGA